MDEPLNLEFRLKLIMITIQENSNGLENFELSEETPQLFNTNREIENDAKEENFNSMSLKRMN